MMHCISTLLWFQQTGYNCITIIKIEQAISIYTKPDGLIYLFLKTIYFISYVEEAAMCKNLCYKRG